MLAVKYVRHARSILLVEDEDFLRRLLGRFLTQQGYNVLAAADSDAAMELWSQNNGNIGLLLTDVVLENGLSGKEFAHELQQQNPGLKVIYTSGLSAETLGLDLKSSDTTFVQKPYLPETLLEAINRALAETPG